MTKQSTELKMRVMAVKKIFEQRGIKSIWPVYLNKFPDENTKEKKKRFQRVTSFLTVDKKITENLEKLV